MRITSAVLCAAVLFLTPDCSTVSMKAKGPLSAHPTNPRYFTDGSGKAVYLTGCHTWSNLRDMGPDDPPAAFDFDAYIDFLEELNHNFIRMWAWDLTKYSVSETILYAGPFPWKRTGPGMALDGKPKFDLAAFDDAYFDRLRARVIAAGERGIYVSVMLFEGWALHASKTPWCWDGHPFNGENNINGIEGDADGDGRGIESQTLDIPAVTAIQEAYVRKVIDTVNDLDNVLYEIVNESGPYSTEWQYHMIRFIHDYEKTRPKQHPVGMTFQWASKERGTNAMLFESPADWISPNPEGGYRENPPAGDGSKVILTDTDHLWGIGGNRPWVWKSFCRGLNPLFMDRYGRPSEGVEKPVWADYLSPVPAPDPEFDTIRASLGYTRSYAERMNLAEAAPKSELSSTSFCLAVPGREYLVYAPEGGTFTVDLSAGTASFAVEWMNPETGERTPGGSIEGGKTREFTPLFEGDAVLFLSGGKR